MHSAIFCDSSNAHSQLIPRFSPLFYFLFFAFSKLFSAMKARCNRLAVAVNAFVDVCYALLYTFSFVPPLFKFFLHFLPVSIVISLPQLRLSAAHIWFLSVFLAVLVIVRRRGNFRQSPTTSTAWLTNDTPLPFCSLLLRYSSCFAFFAFRKVP